MLCELRGMTKVPTLMIIARDCDMGESGDVNTMYTFTIGQCTNVNFGYYSKVVPLGFNSYTLLSNCTDATCSSCIPVGNLALNLCNKIYNNTMAILATITPCQAAWSNPAQVANNSISLLWHNSTLTCTGDTLTSIVTFGSVSTSKTCIATAASGVYASIQLNSDGTYSAGYACNVNCMFCAVSIASTQLNVCNASPLTGSSISIQSTVTLPTCYQPTQQLFLSYTNNWLDSFIFYFALFNIYD